MPMFDSSGQPKNLEALANLVTTVSGASGVFLISSLQTGVLAQADTRASGGTSLFSTSAGIAQTSAIKSSGGRLYGTALFNPNTLPQYLQVFDVSATTSVTLGTTVPAAIFAVQASASFHEQFEPGITFSNGIVVAVTSAAAGATAGANAMVVNVFYA